MKALITLSLCLLVSSILAQRVEYHLTTPGDTTKNYFIAIHPEQDVKGAIVVLPGFGELPEETLANWDIHKVAPSAGFLTIIPALGDRLFFYVDSLSHRALNQFVDEIFARYNLQEDTFFIGGKSLGGTMAVQYAERAYKVGSSLKKPAGVFAIDPPLDLERLIRTMTTSNRPEKSQTSIEEDRYVVGRLWVTFGINPIANPELYWPISPYAQSDPEHRSIQSLLDVPIRIYNEPDINWYIENRNSDLRHMNVIDSAAMINWLRALGNDRAELILTSGKGFRLQPPSRHPHSWTIADSQGLVEWMYGIVD